VKNQTEQARQKKSPTVPLPAEQNEILQNIYGFISPITA